MIELFPLPPLDLLWWGEGATAPTGTRVETLLVNLWIAALNYLHEGAGGEASALAPSAAQPRVLARLRVRARLFLRRAPVRCPTQEELMRYMKLNELSYNGGQVSIALGLSAGIPALAATCNSAQVLSDWNAELAHQCEEPWALLLPRSQWPAEIEREFSLLARDYPQLVSVGVQAGLFEMAEHSELETFAGRPIVSGGFGVPKEGSTESRFIAPRKVLNRLVDPAKVQKVEFSILATSGLGDSALRYQSQSEQT